MTGELSKLLDEIKLCQEKDYSFEDLCHTISDHYLDNLSKISEEELGKNGSQSVVSKGGKKPVRLSLPVQCVPKRHGLAHYLICRLGQCQMSGYLLLFPSCSLVFYSHCMWRGRDAR